MHPPPNSALHPTRCRSLPRSEQLARSSLLPCEGAARLNAHSVRRTVPAVDHNDPSYRWRRAILPANDERA
jgi:hypothetical protein